MNKINIKEVFDIIKEELKDYTIPLVEQIQFKTKKPLFVLIGTILSSKTKDQVTAKASNKLFKKIKNINDLNNLTIKQIEKLIYPVGFYKTKAEQLKKLPKIINDNFDGIIPSDIDDLLKLPGVGRKTANLVTSVAFNKPGICVDTHVHRIMNRFGYVKTENALETEMELRKKLPENLWKQVNYYLVILGQNICKPIKPNCEGCPLNKICPKINVK
jgi:endonuclease-3